ncbi:unnamed protein product [Oikopleura dioica]|uniref:RING-type domain-containing protein n=1 Tax=Oikopleura dioica TaxID=34765 RepID=E4YP35_OIKDI|nr:unnamed protein product [Oikopleura dioica]
MGFDAEIDNSERNSVVENLKDEIQCSICCSIFEEPMKLDCCDGHICKKCFESVKKKFQNCPLCRKANFTAKFSRLMVTVLSQYKLFCPAEECNESVLYVNFAQHKKTCPALNKKPCPSCKKLYWHKDFADHFLCFEDIIKKAQADQKKLKDLETKNKSLKQSKESLSQNNKNLIALKTEHENKIAELEQFIAEDSKKIKNQKNNLSFLNKKISENAQKEQKKQKVWENKLNSAISESQKFLQQAEYNESRYSMLHAIVHEMTDKAERMKSDKAFLESELNAANNEIINLTEKLMANQNKSSGFFGLF